MLMVVNDRIAGSDFCPKWVTLPFNFDFIDWQKGTDFLAFATRVSFFDVISVAIEFRYLMKHALFQSSMLLQQSSIVDLFQVFI